ncbi:MAG: hypothetical protein ACKV2T_39150 [Kofleriaceae bacterium]
MWSKIFGIGDLDGPAFTQLVAKIGTQTGRLEDPAVDAANMRIVDRSGTMNLGNMYGAFKQLPRRKRLAYLNEVVLAPLPDIPETWEQIRPMLVPVVRDGAYLTFAPLQTAIAIQQETPAIACRPLAPGIFETLVVDTPNKMLVVSEDRLVDWNVTLEDALDVAYGNLRRNSQDEFTPLIPGLWIAPWSDSYAAARVMLPEILQRVCTNPLVALPNRDTLLVAESTTEGFMLLVVALEKAVEDQHYAITCQIYQLVDKKLTVFTPPSDTPAPILKLYERLLIAEKAMTYGREQELHQQHGTEAFYAKLMAYESKDGEIITRATWTKGVDEGYLPPAQAIHFIELDESIAQAIRMWEVPWSTVVAEPGMLTPTNAPLPRWKTGEFPSAAWLDKHGTKLKDTVA